MFQAEGTACTQLWKEEPRKETQRRCDISVQRGDRGEAGLWEEPTPCSILPNVCIVTTQLFTYFIFHPPLSFNLGYPRFLELVEGRHWKSAGFPVILQDSV